VWFFWAVAFDLDGTLAVRDRVATEVIAAIDEVRPDRAVLLVTGRVRADLERVFPGLAGHFDAVVTENGAVLSTSKGTRLLHQPVDPSVHKALADRGVRADRGEVLLAADGRDAATATEVIAGLGLDCQVVHNRGRAMVLPAEVTKGSGLVAALDELELSVHNAISVGDAENDLSLLRSAEVGVAVADAVPSLLEHADMVLEEPNGTGVVGLLGGPLLAGHERFCPPRRSVTIGTFDDSSPVLVPGSQCGVLVTGDTGVGKSYLAGLLAERWIEAGYSVLVIDPEGDHLGLSERQAVHLVDAAAHLPAPHDLLQLMRPRHASLVLDISGLDADARAAYLRRLPDAVAAERAEHGTPHWVVLDEAHQHDWIGGLGSALPALVEPGTCLVTWRPELLPTGLSAAADLVIDVQAGEGGAGWPHESRALFMSAGMARPFRIGTRLSAHVRHWHKYATTPLPVSRRFHFHGSDSSDPDAGAATLEEFGRQLRHCDLGTIGYHLARADFSKWVGGAFADPALTSELAGIERDVANGRAAALERPRQQIWATIQNRYFEI
jgi:hydroxymethylpyrimidine pyrophosphatase-like HAD family hydrolase